MGAYSEPNRSSWLMCLALTREPLEPSGTSNSAPKTTELSGNGRMRGHGEEV